MVVETIPQLFFASAKKYDKVDAFLYKRAGRYVSCSHQEVLGKVYRAALGLLSLGLKKQDKVALLSENRLEWVIADLSILSAGCVNVPVYATLPAEQVEFILKDSEAKAVFVSDRTQLEKIAEIRRNLPDLRVVISFGPTAEDAMTLADLIAKGETYRNPPGYEEMVAKVEPGDWASIIYTSGTTGLPKGAVLTHSNFVSNAVTCSTIIEIGPSDSCLSFLPLSHVFERTAGYYTMLHAGVTVAYAESIDTVPQNLLEVRPTVMVSVPRLYEKMYARVLDNATSGSWIKKNIFFWAVNTGKDYVREKLAGKVSGWTGKKYALARKLVFSKLKERTGGRLRFFVSGGAPLARDIAEFFYAAGLPILEGYGLTETSPVVSVNTFEHFKFGTVGRPIPAVEVKIDSDGEIMVRGPNIMKGYFKRSDLTAEVMDGDWFRTGDIGVIDEDGFLSITDRKKDIIVTAGGKNVAPQPIENRLKTSKYITQAVLIGDKRKFISALIVPNFDNLLKFARAASIPFTDNTSLISNPKVIEKIAAEIERKSEGLASFERVKKFVLLDQDFSLETDELTPTLKVKRAVIEKKFKDKIDKLYEEE